MTGPSADVYVSTMCQDGRHDACPVLRKTNRIPCSCDGCDHSQALGPTATVRGENAQSRHGYVWVTIDGRETGVRQDLTGAAARELALQTPDSPIGAHLMAVPVVLAVLRAMGAAPGE